MNNFFTETERARAAKILLILGVLGALFLAGKAWNEMRLAGLVGREGVVQATVSVEGKGEVVVKPDIATFSFTVSEEANTAGEAQSKVSLGAERAISFLKESGIDEEDIKTLGYSINPKYEYQYCSPFTACPTREPKIIGYQVSQSMEVKVRDIEKAGDVLSGVGKLPVRTVGGLSFSVDEEEQYKEEARAEAIENAQAKAKKLSKDLGVRLVRVVSFSEFGNYPPVYGLGGEKSYAYDAAPASVQVPAGENKITSQVNITYEIR